MGHHVLHKACQEGLRDPGSDRCVVTLCLALRLVKQFENMAEEVETDLEAVVRGHGLAEGDAVAEELLFRQLVNKNDLRGHENGGLAGAVGRRNFYESIQEILDAALKGQAAARDG